MKNTKILDDKEIYTKELNNLNILFKKKKINTKDYIFKTNDIINKMKLLKNLTISEKIKLTAYDKVLNLLNSMKNIK